jgi:glycosyltransferase involved in cell wall biosynthesis
VTVLPGGQPGDGGPRITPALPTVTVVIPTKDRFDTLLTTLSCVLAQRDVEVRVVVVEDGGSDGTMTRLQDTDPRVRALRHPRSLGVAQARNTGLAEVRTFWVAFVDDDDLWAPDKLHHQLQALAAQPQCRWACSAAAVFSGAGRILGIHTVPQQPDVSVALLRANVVPGGGSAVLAETTLLREVGGFDTSLSNLADWDCWLRLAQRSPLARVAAVDVAYRRHSTSMVHAVERSERELEQLRATHAELYRAVGVDVDWLPWLWYLHGLTYSSGHWGAGVRRSWRLFRDYRQTRALVQPLRYASSRIGRWRDARLLADLPHEDCARARVWLTRALAG